MPQLSLGYTDNVSYSQSKFGTNIKTLVSHKDLDFWLLLKKKNQKMRRYGNRGLVLHARNQLKLWNSVAALQSRQANWLLSLQSPPLSYLFSSVTCQ